MRPGAILSFVACLSLGLASPAESNLRSSSPMMGDGVPRTGPAGPPGERGEKGEPGIAGQQGERGPRGNTGAKGDAGPQGEPGRPGERGLPGADGAPGQAGQRGAEGPPGPQGNVGPQGMPGSTGTPGGKGDRGDAGPKGDAGQQGLKGDKGDAGPAGTPKRVERYTATANASGVATFTWAACTTAPDVDVIPTWSGEQMIVGGVTGQTLTGATVAVKRSRGTLLLTAGPFEPAPSTPITIRVICN